MTMPVTTNSPNPAKYFAAFTGEARIDQSSQSVSEARPAKVDLILADTSGKMDTWRNLCGFAIESNPVGTPPLSNP
jgi:hypothetical protein